MKGMNKRVHGITVAGRTVVSLSDVPLDKADRATTQINFRADPRIYAYICNKSKELDMTIQAFMDYVIRRHIQRDELDKGKKK